MDFYPWVVLIHVLAAFAFAMAHGVSAFAAFAMRGSKEPASVRTLLTLSGMSLGALYISLLTLLIAGIAAAIMGGWFGRGWPWASIGVVVVVIAAMYGMASRYYAGVRSAVGMPSMNDKKGEAPPAPVSQEELARILDTRRPEALAAIGVIGFAVLVWLMELKPF
ncbi:MAG TPA: hypothetical protein VFV72_01990 [Candidatus Limnocylindrales bacterium]|nr:hypothetical protein [Candidatus Limnocylindrales bacterium]